MPVSGLRPVYTAEGGGSTSKSVAQKAATQKRTPVPKPVAEPPKGTVPKPSPVTAPQSSSNPSAGTQASQAEPDYMKYVKYYGSPETYARLIQEKESRGIPLDDPAAAEAFKKAYPGYFDPRMQALGNRLAEQMVSAASDTMAASLNSTTTAPQQAPSSSASPAPSAPPITPSTAVSPQPSPLVEPPKPKIEIPVAKPNEPPKFELISGNVPVEGIEPVSSDTQAQAQVEELPKGLGGFMLQGGALMPSPEVLYNHYKSLTGRDSEEARQQLQAAYEGGAVPMWMASDPVWRAVFAKAGVNPRELRVNALKRRLGR